METNKSTKQVLNPNSDKSENILHIMPQNDCGHISNSNSNKNKSQKGYITKSCNLYSCKQCNKEWQERKADDWHRDNTRAPQRPKKLNKYCLNNCHYCQRKLRYLEDQIYFQAASSQWAPNNADQSKLKPVPEDDFLTTHRNSSSSAELEKNIMTLKKRNFTKEKTAGDGDCLYHSILANSNLQPNLSVKLRQKVADSIEKSPLTIEELTDDETIKSKEELINIMRTQQYYPGYVEITVLAKQLKAWICILLEDKKYELSHTPWQIVKGNDEEIIPDNIIFLALYQGNDTKNPRGGHYSKLTPKKKPENTTLDVELSIFLDLDKNPELTPVNILIWNITSIRSYSKRTILARILKEKSIDIAFIIESFLSPEDPLYIRGYKVIRADNALARRKGVVILANQEITCSYNILEKSPHGRFLKVILRDPDNNLATSISAAYLEATESLDSITIPRHILDADIVAGDLNRHDSDLLREGLYHYKGLEITEQIDTGNISHHKALLAKTLLPFKRKEKMKTKTILSNRIAEDNTRNIELFVTGKSLEPKTSNPYIEINIPDIAPEPTIDNYVEEWAKLKEKEEEVLRNLNQNRASKLNSLLTAHSNLDEKWSEIGAILQIKKKGSLYNPDQNLDTYVNGFKIQFNDSGIFKDNRALGEIILNIFTVCDKYHEILKGLPPLKMPYTKAKDYYGYTQQWLLNTINEQNQENNRLTQFRSAYRICKKLIDQKTNLLHTITRMILVNKIEEVIHWSQLRPISIIPSHLAILEKLIYPLCALAVNGIIAKNQYGFKPDSSCNHAKLYLSYLCHKKQFSKILLVDIRKAYDSVELDILANIIRNKIHHEDAKSILLSMLEIYKLLSINIHGRTINPKKGLPQGGALSPLLFNLYINDILEDPAWSSEGINLQAYADDIILQSNNVQIFTEAMNHLTSEFKQLNLDINYDKCELLSDNTEDKITTPNNTTIEAKPAAKYLGQEIDNKGEPTISLTNKSFSKLLSLIEKNSGLTTSVKIKIFKIYLQSRLNHLIPLYVMTGKTKTIWTNIRKMLFRSILNKCTLPRESAGNFKCAFFDLILKPVIKITENIMTTSTDQDYINFLQQSCAKAALEMIDIEPNHHQDVANLIVRANNNQYIQLELWQDAINKSISTRLWIENWNKDTEAMARKITMPSLIFFLSNAPYHILEENIPKNITKPGDDINDAKRLDRKNRIISILITYKMANIFHNTITRSIAPLLQKDNWRTTAEIQEYYSLITLSIKTFIEAYINNIRIEAEEDYKRLVAQTNKEEALKLLSQGILNQISQFRIGTLARDRKLDLESEILIETCYNSLWKNSSQTNAEIQMGKEKKNLKPGRPKKEKPAYPRVDMIEGFNIKR